MTKENRKIFLLTLCLLVLSVFTGRAQAPPAQDFSKVQIKAVPVADGLYVLVGDGLVNVAASVGKDGILLVDDQYANTYPNILQVLGTISKLPVRYVLNSHWHGDTLGGNEVAAKAGAVIIGSDNARKRLIAQRTDTAAQDARNPPLPDSYLPSVTFSNSMTLHFNGEDIEIIQIGPGHTDADSIVYFHHANVIDTGDLFDTGRFPIIILAHGGSAKGLIAAQERIMKIANADTKILPGKGGPFATVKDIQEQRDMIATVRDRVQKGIQAGKTLDQILASKPTAEWEAVLKIGRPSADFVTLIYQELTAKVTK